MANYYFKHYFDSCMKNLNLTVFLRPFHSHCQFSAKESFWTHCNFFLILKSRHRKKKEKNWAIDYFVLFFNENISWMMKIWKKTWKHILIINNKNSWIININFHATNFIPSFPNTRWNFLSGIQLTRTVFFID